MAIRRKRSAENEEKDPKLQKCSSTRATEADNGEGKNHLATCKSGCFEGVNVLFISGGVSPKRLQIWKERVKGLGGVVVEPCNGIKKCLTHVLANDHKFLTKDASIQKLKFSQKVSILKYKWVEDCLKEGKLLPCDLYRLEDLASNSSSCCITREVPEVSNNALPESRTSAFSIEMKVDDFKQDTEISHGACHAAGELNAMELGVETEISSPKAENLDFDEDDNFERKLDSDEENECEKSNMDRHAKCEPPGLNEHITGILREMWDIYESVLGDEWRSLTYRKAAIQLEKLPCRIFNFEDVKHLPGIGSSMVEKIKEILCTGRLQKLESLKADPKVQTLQHLASIWGVGPKLAQKLYQAGHRSVEDLVKESSLSQMARIGIMYYKDLTLRIPRDEVEAAEKYVQRVAEDLCPGICIRVAGSYRRGKLTCGDIDFLATHPDGYSHKGFLVKLVGKLKSTGFVTEGLHCTDHSSEGTKKVDTFMGIGRIPEHQHYRRLDIKVYPKEAYAFALVYFTGNDVLNRKIRYAAQRKGYKLNDQGLFIRFGGKKGISSTKCIPCETEEEVFSKVGFPYYEPHDREL